MRAVPRDRPAQRVRVAGGLLEPKLPKGARVEVGRAVELFDARSRDGQVDARKLCHKVRNAGHRPRHCERHRPRRRAPAEQAVDARHQRAGRPRRLVHVNERLQAATVTRAPIFERAIQQKMRGGQQVFEVRGRLERPARPHHDEAAPADGLHQAVDVGVPRMVGAVDGGGPQNRNAAGRVLAGKLAVEPLRLGFRRPVWRNRREGRVLIQRFAPGWVHADGAVEEVMSHPALPGRLQQRARGVDIVAEVLLAREAPVVLRGGQVHDQVHFAGKGTLQRGGVMQIRVHESVEGVAGRPFVVPVEAGHAVLRLGKLPGQMPPNVARASGKKDVHEEGWVWRWDFRTHS